MRRSAGSPPEGGSDDVIAAPPGVPGDPTARVRVALVMVSCSSWIGWAGELSARRLRCCLLRFGQCVLRAAGTAERLLHAGPHRLGALGIRGPQVVARAALRRLDRVDPRLE